MKNKTILAIATTVAISVLFIAAIAYYYGPSLDTSQSLSSTDQADLNWAGYAVAYSFSDPKPVVTGVSGSWVVPQIAYSENDTYSAIWVGIGGIFGHTLIQTGTEQDCVDGAISYSAWYELLPSDSVVIPTMDISPGDTIAASINLAVPSMDMWTISLSDLSTGQGFQQDFHYDSSRLSAECVVERPDLDNNTMTNIANFGKVMFSNCTATMNDITSAFGYMPSSRLFMYDTEGSRLADVSTLSNDKSSFTITYIKSQ